MSADVALKPADGTLGVMARFIGHEVCRAAVGAAEESMRRSAAHASLGVGATAEISRGIG